jgi:serine/threonine protein kinase
MKRLPEANGREIRVMASIDDPTVLRLCGWIPDPPTIVTDFASRGSLDDLIVSNQKVPGWDEMQKYIVLFGVAVGMMRLHRRRIIHRDLTPANIFLDENLEPKIADFGFSKPVAIGATLNQTGELGTSVYEAPEIMLSEVFGFPVDVYAYGVLFNATVTGEAPFCEHAGTLFRLFRKVCQGHCPRISGDINEAWKSLIVQCWDADPGLRPAFADIVARMTSQEFAGPRIDADRLLAYREKIGQSPRRFLLPGAYYYDISAQSISFCLPKGGVVIDKSVDSVMLCQKRLDAE